MGPAWVFVVSSRDGTGRIFIVPSNTTAGNLPTKAIEGFLDHQQWRLPKGGTNEGRIWRICRDDQGCFREMKFNNNCRNNLSNEIERDALGFLGQRTSIGKLS
jgi:hypothetical protein